MHQTTVDGVATLWDDLPGPFTAALVVGMGAADETFTTSGITHLIEHLVMARIGRRPIRYNANVGIHHTSFVASGDRADVLTFIGDVARQLSEPDISRIAHETKVLQIEGGIYDSSALAEALRARCGYRGAGLTFAPEPDLTGITAQSVTQLTSRLVCKEGCVLVLSGAPTQDVRIPLPEGHPDRFPDTPFLPLTTPAAVRGFSEDEVTLSFLTPEPSETLGLLLSERAFDALRMRDAQSYGIDAHTSALNGVGVSAISADFGEDGALAVARALRRELDRLVTEPPTEGERAHVRSELRLRYEDPVESVDLMMNQAGRMLRGLPARQPADAIDAELALVEGDHLDRALAMAQDTLLVHLPLDVWDEFEGSDRFDDLPLDQAGGASADEFPTDCDVFRHRSPLGIRRRAAVALTEDAIVLRQGRVVLRAAWSEIVGVGRWEDTRLLVLLDGGTVEIRGRAFRRGRNLLSQLDARTADRQFSGDSCGRNFG